MLLESKVLRWQTMGIGNRKKRSGRQIPRTIYRRHRRRENTGGTNTVSSQRWGFCRGQTPAPLGSRRSADGQICMARFGPAGPSDHTRARYLRLRLQSTEKVERTSSDKDGCWCGVVCARLLLDRGRVEVRSRAGRRIAYLAVYVLFVLPVSHQTYSEARAESALIAADDARSLRILLPKRTSVIFKILYLIVNLRE